MTEPKDLLQRLTGLLGPAAVIAEGSDLQPYAVDWRKLFPGKPACVVRPSSTEQVAQVVQICREAGAAIVPQGGNTGLAGGAVPDASGTQVVLSLNRMAAIRHVDPVGLTIEAEAGCILKVAQDAAASAGRLLPISLAAEGSATIGGVVAANAGGVNVLRYGMTRSLVLGLEVVLPDGTIVNGLRRLRKDNAGYDWKQLFIGSEGTLGIVTAAILQAPAAAEAFRDGAALGRRSGRRPAASGTRPGRTRRPDLGLRADLRHLHAACRQACGPEASHR